MDDIAREYVILSLAIGELEDGIVDAYFGPPELRDEAAGNPKSAEALADEAAALRGRVAIEVGDAQRARWLDRQLVALETLCQRIGGEQIPYLEEVTRCFDAAPEATPDEAYTSLHETLDSLLPGSGDVRARLDERDASLTIPPERLPEAIDWLVGQLRERASQIWPLPEGESLIMSIVTNEPWSAYNWYDGDLKSRVEVNTDEPVRASGLIQTMAHETFPGHHLEHAWKEQRLVREQGRAESSVQLINTPEAYVSEGLAEVGGRLVAPENDWQQLFMELCARSDLAMTSERAQREWQVNQALRAIRGSSGDAALMLHDDGRSRDEVIEFLEQKALRTRQEAERTLGFINHPLWRSYIFCYAGGERLLTRWCKAAGDEDAQRRRFFRLLTEQLTPSGIAEEIAAENTQQI